MASSGLNVSTDDIDSLRLTAFILSRLCNFQSKGWLRIGVLLYDSDMLEDLDHLSERLTKLVAHTQQLNADRQALQATLKQVVAERDALVQQLDREGSQAKALHSKVQSYESELEGLRTQSSAKHAVLQGSLDLFKQEQTTLQAQLESRNGEVTALRAATIQAKERIDAVLERLPGAQPQEQI